jgi:Tfp pilus assembly protein PilV
MPRLIALIVLVVAVLGIASIVKRAKRSSEQRKDTYRPSSNGQSGSGKNDHNQSQDASGKSFKKPDDDSAKMKPKACATR